jgi:hypothetical protein
MLQTLPKKERTGGGQMRGLTRSTAPKPEFILFGGESEKPLLEFDLTTTGSFDINSPVRLISKKGHLNS